NAALQAKVARQQRHLRDAVVARDATIASLNEMLAKAIAARLNRSGAEPADSAGEGTGARLISDLRRRLTAETARRERADRRLESLAAERDAERKQRQALERRACNLREEVEASEQALAQLLPGPEAAGRSAESLAGTTLLYVGGRPHQAGQLRKLAQQWSATLLHHDGGIDDRSGLLEAQVARADRTLFPVDCVSHNAVAVIKRVARSTGRPYVALRSSGLSSFVVALRLIAAQQQRD